MQNGTKGQKMATETEIKARTRAKAEEAVYNRKAGSGSLRKLAGNFQVDGCSTQGLVKG